VFYRSIFDLVRDFMKDEAFNQQDRTLRRYLKSNELQTLTPDWVELLAKLN
jgi:hypothetical protein